MAKKYADQIVTKCVTKPDEANQVHEEMSKSIRHNVPHRWDLSNSMVPHWCCHCGYMLPVGTKKAFEKCIGMM